jgi:deoxyribonuclease V
VSGPHSFQTPHAWDLSPEQAIAIQRELQSRIITKNRLGTIQRVAGVDVGFADAGQTTRAAVCVFDVDGLEQVDAVLKTRETVFPYIPGLLSFREIPAVLDALGALSAGPDLLLCDGQGIAHPRRLGIASHLGLITGIPSIGVGKSRLSGAHGTVPEGRGKWTSLMDRNERIGCVLRTREHVKPVYVSPGHRIDFETAVKWVMKTTTRYKLPEPIRAADRLASSR